MTWVRRRGTPPNHRARLAQRDQEAAELIEAGEYRAAFNYAVQAVQAELARVMRERPDDGATLYAYYAREFFRLAESVQQHVVPSDSDLRKVAMTRVALNRARPIAPRGT